MATVDGYTAQRMQQIEDETVVDGAIVGDELILQRRDGTPINAGVVVGPQGDQGDTGPPGADAQFAGYDEPVNNLGNVSGAVSIDLATHNVYKLTPTAPITITFTNMPAAGFITPITLIVTTSAHAITWPAGTKYDGGVAPTLDGETWLAAVAQSTHVTVGAAWTKVA